MANANVLELMAQYDFNSPINITLLFDDSDDDLEILEENEKKDYSDTENIVQDNKALKKKDETKSLQSEANTQKKCNESNKSLLLNVAVKELQNNKSSVEISNQSKKNELEKNSPNGEEEKTSNTLNERRHQHVIAPDPFYEHPRNVTPEALSETRQTEEHIAYHNYTEKPVSLLDDLLNTLSEHIILVMHAFYRYGTNRNASKYTQIKNHFFELSYNTMISIIVPQEQNKRFINVFLENTVRIANIKKWKCHRGHLDPFFNELFTWTKNKMCVTKRLNSELSLGENYHLKQHLSKPLQTINQSFLETPASQRQHTSNNVCIFSSGNSGVEINVNPDTLINCNTQQNSHTVEWLGVQNNNALNKSYQTGSENRIISQACENKTNNYTKNFNCKYHRRLTPYSVIQNSINNQIRKTVLAIQSSRNNEHPLHEIQAKRQHITYSNIEKRPTQLQTNNETHSTSSTSSGFKNALNENINNQMLRLQLQTTNEAIATQEPVISNVISLNPIADRTIEGRCCVCGKTTYITCSKCNEPSYCSFLCQEFDKYNGKCNS